MSDAVFERYKDALRRGHLAAARGKDAAAVDAYAEASRIAPDRALPFVGVGTVLGRMERWAEALGAFDAALDRAPADEPALRGRADAQVALGDASGAARTMDRLSATLEAASRLAEATEAASRALELAESRARRASLFALVARVRAETPDDPRAEAAVAAASAVLEPIIREPVVVEPEPEPFDPVAAVIEVEAAIDSGDADRIATVALAAAAGHRAADQPSAAVDACFVALEVRPADPALHLALAELYLDRGWRAPAVDKLVLLARLAELTEDDATRTQLCRMVANRLPDEPRLAAICV